MKKISLFCIVYILLLTSLSCFSQTSNKFYEVVKIEITTDSTEIEDSGINEYLIKLMTKYKTECYNDSTYMRVHKENPKGLCYVYYDECANKDHYEYRWVHKEPEFNDFIEWILKR